MADTDSSCCSFVFVRSHEEVQYQASVMRKDENISNCKTTGRAMTDMRQNKAMAAEFRLVVGFLAIMQVPDIGSKAVERRNHCEAESAPADR